VHLVTLMERTLGGGTGIDDGAGKSAGHVGCKGCILVGNGIQFQFAHVVHR
jgi:hypothetical protein